MSAEVPVHTREIDTSLMNFFDSSMLGASLWPVERFVDVMEESGYTQLQWHPVRGIAAGVQMQAGWVDERVKEAIGSLHQSWRSEKKIL